jgi:hypothetical protein
MFLNAIRERGQANASTNPDLGHWHVYGEEFWFIIEGTVGFLKEGAPYKVANAGDIVYNPPMRWHRMGTDGSNNGTRIAINGYRFGAHHLPYPTNTTSDQQIPFSILVTPPTTTPTLSPVTSNQRTVKLTAYPHANSTEDGIDYSEYWLDGAVTPTRYTGPFQISGAGLHPLCTVRWTRRAMSRISRRCSRPIGTGGYSGRKPHLSSTRALSTTPQRRRADSFTK